MVIKFFVSGIAIAIAIGISAVAMSYEHKLAFGFAAMLTVFMLLMSTYIDGQE